MEYRTGMFNYALAFLLGVVFVQQLAELPTLSQILGTLFSFALATAFVNLLIRWFRPLHSKQYTLIIYCILLFIIGIIFSSLYASKQLSYRLNDDLIGSNLLLTGTVAGLPVTAGNVQRFEFNVEQFHIIGTGNVVDGDDTQRLKSTQKFPKKIRLSWYYGQDVRAAEKWQFEVRLKPPHGFLNPGSFDYESWLFQNGIQATGYVRQSALNKKQAPPSNTSILTKVTRLRQELRYRIDKVSGDDPEDKSKSFALLKALAIGDKSAISNQQWRVLTATGTSHLMAISGLHIGLAALFAFVLIRRFVPVSIIKSIPAQHVALIGSIFIALLYALVAGLSIPTQRAFIMLFVLSVMMLIRRNHRPVDALGFALILVLFVDPLAVLSAGFWFSFSAVAVIFLSVNSYATESLKYKDAFNRISWKIIFVIKKWIRLQLLISIFLLPLSLFMFQQVSLVSPIVNLLLIPYVSFLVVPLVLLALCFTFISPEIAEYIFSLSASLLDLVWPLLTYLSEQPYSLWTRGDVGIVKLLMATTALCLLYYSVSLVKMFTAHSNKKHINLIIYVLILFLSSALFTPVFIGRDSSLRSGEYQVTVLDVGQGSAAVVRTKNHVAVFDTGARFSERLDAGRSVVIPYLRSQGIEAIDQLIISHGDADHIGGATAILESFPVATLVGQDIDKLQANNKQVCSAGLKWQWDGIDLEFLSPLKPDQDDFITKKRNNQSCVLKISSPAGSVLFTGDIERKVEQQLLSQPKNQLKSDVLIVPHHGSKTSSSQEFLEAVGSKISIISVGYKNRYKLPNKQVLSRYKALNSQLLRTDKNGAIMITLARNEQILLYKYRDRAKRYWHHTFD